MEDNIKTIASCTLETISELGNNLELTNDDVLKGLILALCFVAVEVDVTRDSFLEGIAKGFDSTAASLKGDSDDTR